MPEAVLVAAVRTPVGRAPKGALSTSRPDDLAATALTGALDRVPALDKSEIDDVILGCAQPEGEQGWNIARLAALRAGLPVEIPGVTVNRLCASGLEAIAQADQRIRAGGDRVVVAGGAESMSLLPFGGIKPSPNPWLAEQLPRLAAHHGPHRRARRPPLQHLPRRSGRLRPRQPSESPRRASRRPLCRRTDSRHRHHRRPRRESRQAPRPGNDFSADEGPRADTSAEALAKLKPAFHAQGTVTAGNSSQTSDGAAAAVLMDSARARELGLRPSRRLVAYAVTGCLPEEMGIGPITAIPKALEQRRPYPQRHRPHRTERSLCRAGAGHHPRARPRSRPRQRQRRRHRPRPSPRLHRRQAHRDAARTRCAAAMSATAWSPCASAAAWAPPASSS